MSAPALPEVLTMSATMTIRNVMDMIRGLFTNQKHGELFLGIQMDCGRMGIWRIKIDKSTASRQDCTV
jgi:hypothetical protein